MKKSLDIFPALLKIAPSGSLEDFRTLTPVGAAPEGTRRLDRCRTIIVNEKLFIVVDTPTGPELIFREGVVDFYQSEGVAHVVTETGKILAIKKDPNCGCGSRLRSWDPFKNIAFAQSDDDGSS